VKTGKAHKLEGGASRRQEEWKKHLRQWGWGRRGRVAKKADGKKVSVVQEGGTQDAKRGKWGEGRGDASGKFRALLKGKYRDRIVGGSILNTKETRLKMNMRKDGSMRGMRGPIRAPFLIMKTSLWRV